MSLNVFGKKGEEGGTRSVRIGTEIRGGARSSRGGQTSGCTCRGWRALTIPEFFRRSSIFKRAGVMEFWIEILRIRLYCSRCNIFLEIIICIVQPFDSRIDTPNRRNWIYRKVFPPHHLYFSRGQCVTGYQKVRAQKGREPLTGHQISSCLSNLSPRTGAQLQEEEREVPKKWVLLVSAATWRTGSPCLLPYPWSFKSFREHEIYPSSFTSNHGPR